MEVTINLYIVQLTSKLKAPKLDPALGKDNVIDKINALTSFMNVLDKFHIDQFHIDKF